MTTRTKRAPGTNPTRTHAKAGSFARLSRLAAAFLRVLALLFATEFSGLAHVALDGAAAFGVLEHPDDGCDSREESHECPPGCLSCHCAHSTPGWTPTRGDDLRHVADYPPVEAATFVVCESVPALGAVLTPPDRPPRVAAVS